MGKCGLLKLNGNHLMTWHWCSFSVCLHYWCPRYDVVLAMIYKHTYVLKLIGFPLMYCPQNLKFHHKNRLIKPQLKQSKSITISQYCLIFCIYSPLRQRSNTLMSFRGITLSGLYAGPNYCQSHIFWWTHRC